MKRGKQTSDRCDCVLCEQCTKNSRDAIFIFFDPTREPGDRVVRGHLKCILANAERALQLIGHWDGVRA